MIAAAKNSVLAGPTAGNEPFALAVVCISSGRLEEFSAAKLVDKPPSSSSTTSTSTSICIVCTTLHLLLLTCFRVVEPSG